MTSATLAVESLLAIATAVMILSVGGMLIMRDFYERLHYLAPVAILAPLFIALAVLLQEGVGQAGLKAILVFLALLIVNPVLTHAVARAARGRALGDWTRGAARRGRRPSSRRARR